MYRLYLIIILLVVSNLGCALFENFDELPMYIEVNEVGLTTTVLEGTARHNILDIWPNADGQSLGVFEMPISFPVLDNDLTTDMIYFAGIRRVGFDDDHTIYPFYERITFERDFVPETRIIEELNFNYKDETVFRFIEDFETNNVFTRDVDGDPETKIELSTSDGVEGSCALVTLTETNQEFAVASAIEYTGIPTNGTPVYLELDYFTEINLSIGLQADVNGTEFEQYFLTLTPNQSWNKVYIDLSEILQDSGLDSYRILLGALKDVNGGESEVEIRFDNIKLLHF